MEKRKNDENNRGYLEFLPNCLYPLSSFSGHGENTLKIPQNLLRGIHCLFRKTWSDSAAICRQYLCPRSTFSNRAENSETQQSEIHRKIREEIGFRSKTDCNPMQVGSSALRPGKSINPWWRNLASTPFPAYPRHLPSSRIICGRDTVQLRKYFSSSWGLLIPSILCDSVFHAPPIRLSECAGSVL
jgi:hypothetical protein